MSYLSTNYYFHNYDHLIYPDELEIKDTTESGISASYLDILLIIDSDGRLTTTCTLYKMAKIPKSDQSQNTSRKYKSEK
jgi:hypothetical protein